MGVVYAAYDPELDRKLALKLLRRLPATAGGEQARLLREGQAMARLAHPNVVAVYDTGAFGDGVFVAMELVEGQTLRSWLQSEKRTWRDIVAMFAQAGRGLGAAHAAEIVHRDFKPDNVLVGTDGRARVLDFGLAHASGGAPVAAAATDRGVSLSSAASVDASLVARGSLVGTPRYMPAEQLAGEKVDARADQFALCASLWEALYGEAPFEGEDLLTRLDSLRAGKLPDVRGRGVPSRVHLALARGLAASPADRYPTIDALIDALERDPAAARRRWLVPGAALVAAAASVAFVALRPAPPKVCGGAAEALAATWGPAREDEVHRAFAKTGAARAEETFAHTASVLERYGATWVAMHTATCEATRVRGEQSEAVLDLRMACLAQRRRELQATVDQLATPDEKTLDRAVEAAAKLTPVATCADVEALRAPFAPPKDEAARRAVDDLRRRLAELHAAFTVAHVDAEPALARAKSLVRDADNLGYAPVRAEALYEEGFLEWMFTSRSIAAETLFRAAVAAETVKHDVIAAKAWTWLMRADGDLRHFEDADRAAQLAAAAVERSSSDALRGDLLVGQAEVAYSRGATNEMRAFAEQAASLRERVLGPAHPDTLNARQTVADALRDAGDLEASLPIYRDILEVRRGLFGPTHPATIRSLTDVATGTYELGDYATAIPTLTEACRGPSRTEDRAYYQTYLANALVGAGRVDEGIATFAEARSAIVALEGPRAEVIPEFLAEFSRFLVQREADAQAEADANEALELFAAATGREQERGEALGSRALAEVRRGDARRAAEDAERALAMKSTGDRAEVVPLLARGMAYLATRREADALVDLERAAAVGDEYQGDRPIRAEVRFALARALVATNGDRGRAKVLATRAASELDAAGLTDAARRVRSWTTSAWPPP
jgi:tRNA A-37 threonylcarbamoyl transferase component Bud32/tetratricopeptide (TPR) repeat protein